MQKQIAKASARDNKGLSLGARLMLSPEFGVLVPILILCVVTSILKPNFLTWKYISSILTGSIFIGLAALGEAFVIMNGEVDLSVGTVGCFSGVMFGLAAQNGVGLIPCIVICLAVGIAMGFLNGLLVTKLKLTCWIATLATQYLCTGLAVTLCDGLPISISHLGASVFTRPKPLGLSWLFFVFILILLILDFIVRKTPFGHKLHSSGESRNAAELAGINVNKIKIAAFVLCGLMAATSGLFDVLQSACASSAYGTGREFRAIICCAVGSVSMQGGSGSMLGVGLGVILFHTLWYCLRILDVDTNLQLVLIGAILVLAVLIDIQRKRIEAKKMV